MDIFSDYCFQFFAFIIGTIGCAVLYFEWRALRMQEELKEAVKIILNSDCCISIGRKYLSKRRDEYVIYHFDNNSNLKNENVYPEIDNAISAFCDYVVISDALRVDDEDTD